jgi:hypothetical protein
MSSSGTLANEPWLLVSFALGQLGRFSLSRIIKRISMTVSHS